MPHADSYFSIGHSHDICQDYAAHSDAEPIAVMSDGCSGAPMTDWGARLLVHNHLKYGLEGDTALHVAKAKTKALEIPVEALYGTLGWAGAVVSPWNEHEEQFGPEGDGYIIRGHTGRGLGEQGEVTVLRVEYAGSKPWYPA